jgi:vacuolar-type H+-ATPase subunit H
MTMMNRFIPLVAVAVLLLAGCDKTPTETSNDVAEARKEASQDVSEARQDASKIEDKADAKVAAAQDVYARTDETARAKLTRAESEAMISKAHADFDVALVEANGRHDIAIEKCGQFTGVDKTACLSTADADFTAEQAAITATRDAVLVQAEHHD